MLFRSSLGIVDKALLGTTASHLGNVALRVGRKLTWDSAKERFVDDPEADRMLSRVARAPYAW